MAAMAVDHAGALDAAETSHVATTASLEEAAELAAGEPGRAEKIYAAIIADDSASPEAVRVKEVAIGALGELLAAQGRAADLRALLGQLRGYFALIPKAKTAKIVRGVIDQVARIPGSTDTQLALCRDMVEWCRAEKRTFLRQRVEARLAGLYVERREYQAALALTSSLVREVRRLDDKVLLVDIEVLESRLHQQLRNIPKAKAALTAARTAANAMYTPPLQQAHIDMQSGVLHAEEKDYKTAFSYLYEAYEGFNALDDPRAVLTLKYMLLCKVMMGAAEDVPGIISAKAGLKYSGVEVDAIKAVAAAHSKRSLKDFEEALRSYNKQLTDDPIINRHLAALYDSLLEQNLVRLIEPFSRVEIQHIANLIGLPVQQVEPKLSQMILDHKFEGTLDQGAGTLIVFDAVQKDKLYPSAINTLEHMGHVVDSLFVRSKRIMA